MVAGRRRNAAEMIATSGRLAAYPLCAIQLSSGVRVAPVAVRAVLVETAAAIVVVTVCADIKMVGAKSFFASETHPG